MVVWKPAQHGKGKRVNILEAYRHEDDDYEAVDEDDGHDGA